jgi:hypothetical protein
MYRGPPVRVAAYTADHAVERGLGENKDGEAYCRHSLHPTKYPWVHEQWFKTFDHDA